MEKRIENNMKICVKIMWFSLLIFIPFRNVLELYFGTYVKVIPDICILILTIIFLVNNRMRVNVQVQDIIFVLYVLLAFFNTVILKKISITIYIFGVRSIIVYYIFYFVIRNFKFSKKELLSFTKLIRYITYILFVLGVIEKLGQKNILFPSSVAETIIYADNYARVYGMFFNPNTYGAFLVLGLLIVLHINKKEKLLTYKIVVLATLLLTMSRSSLLILIVTIGIAIIVNWKTVLSNKKELLLQLIMILLCGTMIYFTCEKVGRYIWNQDSSGTTVYDRVSELTDESIVEKSNIDGRLYFVKTGIKVWKDYPILGTGFGTYGSAASMNWAPPIYEKYGLTYGFYADNEYIKDLVETGILGIVLLATFIGSILWHNRKSSFNILFCVAVGGFGMFYNVFEVQIVAFLLWTYLGVSEREYEE